jgi:hypothetical protein
MSVKMPEVARSHSPPAEMPLQEPERILRISRPTSRKTHLENNDDAAFVFCQCIFIA